MAPARRLRQRAAANLQDTTFILALIDTLQLELNTCDSQLSTCDEEKRILTQEAGIFEQLFTTERQQRLADIEFYKNLLEQRPRKPRFSLGCTFGYGLVLAGSNGLQQGPGAACGASLRIF